MQNRKNTLGLFQYANVEVQTLTAQVKRLLDIPVVEPIGDRIESVNDGLKKRSAKLPKIPGRKDLNEIAAELDRTESPARGIRR